VAVVIRAGCLATGDHYHRRRSGYRNRCWETHWTTRVGGAADIQRTPGTRTKLRRL